jgi:predicted Rossmann fold flavoprotein
MNNYDNIIIGGGASGLMCAANVRGRTLLIEKNKRFGSKILASGGGNCNFSNLNISAEKYFSHNPHFVKSALAEFGAADFLAMLKNHGIRWEKREFGQMFAFSSHNILNMLIEEASKDNVSFLCGKAVTGIERGEEGFTVAASGEKYFSRNVIVAAGGVSFPKLGVSSIALETAEKFGLKVYPVKPALCGLNYRSGFHDDFPELSGISLNARIFQGGQSFVNQLLFTHKGLSGPAALQMSVYFDEHAPVEIDFLPDEDVRGIIEAHKKSNSKPSKIFQKYLPKKLLKTVLKNCDYPLADANKKQILEIAEALTSCKFNCMLASFENAEVMSGGISTSRISSKNMECRNVPGLFFTGEALDVTGQLGGYNLHWAWASGFVCAVKGNL